MRVIRLGCSKHGPIETLDLELNKGNYVVSGMAGIGKTNAITILWDLIELNANVKKGARKEVLEAYLEDEKGGSLTCKRENTAKGGSKLTIYDEAGEVIPYAVAKKLISKISKNPLALFEMVGNARFEHLLKCSDVDLSEYNKKKVDRKKLSDSRLAQKHIHDSVKSKLGKKPEVVTFVDISKKQDELKNAHHHNLMVNNTVNEKETLLSGIENLNTKKSDVLERIEELKRKLETIDVAIEESQKRIKDADKWLSENPEKKTDELQKVIDTALETNVKFQALQDWEKQNKEEITENNKWVELDDQVRGKDAEIKAMLDGLTFALDGLAAVGEEIMYNGVNYDKLGTSDQILISATMTAQQIVSEKSSIHAIRIDRGESMDEATEKRVIETCNKIGVQVFISLVDRRAKDEEFSVEIIESK